MAKPAAHFVDCDKKVLTPETWDSPPDSSEVDAADYVLSAVPDSTKTWLLDVNYKYLVKLDNSGSAALNMYGCDVSTDNEIVVAQRPFNSTYPPILLYDSAGAVIKNDYTWNYSGTGAIFHRVVFSTDQNFICANYAGGWYLKWNKTTGARICTIRLNPNNTGNAITSHPNYDSHVILATNTYARTKNYPCVLDTDGVFVDEWDSVPLYGGIFRGATQIACSDTHAFMAGTSGLNYYSPCVYKLSLTDYDDAEWWIPENNPALNYPIAHNIYYYNGSIYVLTERAYLSGVLKNIWKLSAADLSVEASIYFANAFAIWIDGRGRLAVKTAVDTAHDVQLFNMSDLSEIGTVDTEATGDFTIFQLFAPHSLPTTIRHGLSAVSPTSKQNRTTAYPQDYKHLEGETVQVLGDGTYLGTEEVVDGAIALDDDTTVNHVGLKYASKLQPMKIDGEVNVKRIAHIIPNVNESVGGEYGEDIDNMYSMELRASGDPMDKDGDLHTGYVELPFNGSYNRQGDIWIQQELPLPMKILGVGVNLSVEVI